MKYATFYHILFVSLIDTIHIVTYFIAFSFFKFGKLFSAPSHSNKYINSKFQVNRNGRFGYTYTLISQLGNVRYL